MQKKWYDPRRLGDMSDDDRKCALMIGGIGLLLGILIGR